MIEVILYTRQSCHLCEVAHTDLQDIQDKIPHRLKVVDVDSSPELQRKFGWEVPVVEIGPYQLKAPFTRSELEVALGAARDRERHILQIENSPDRLENQGSTWTVSDNISLWFSRHYLAFFNFLVLVYVGLPFLAPVLMRTGLEAPARVIYGGYGFACHQLSYRSFFLFGEQLVYPRTSAGVEDALSFTQATGLSEGSSSQDLYAARAYLGDERIGYKVALCERDVAIYLAIFAFGIIYAVTGRKIPALPWFLWIVIGIAPIGLDGFSQLLSQPPLSFIDFRESTPFLRTLTGTLFGLSTAWFGYPAVEQTMADSRQVMEARFRRLKGKSGAARQKSPPPR